MIRTAVIGTSSITGAFAEAVAQTEGIAIDAVYSRDLERARLRADELGAPRSFADLDAMLADAGIDAVYIASPNSVHGGQARAALAAGAHVFVEKPAVLSVAEWDGLADDARRAGVVLLEAMRTPYDAGFVRVQELLGELGPIRRASLRYESRSARYSRVLAGERVNVFDPAMGGGALLDLGVYVVHAMIALFGEPEDVSGAATLVPSPAPDGVLTEGAGAIVARYPDFVVDLAYSKITRSRLVSEIQGETATMSIDHISSPRRVTIFSDDGEHTVEIDGRQDSLVGEVERFVELIRDGGSADADHARTRATLDILERLRHV